MNAQECNSRNHLLDEMEHLPREAVSKYAPQGLRNSNMAEEKVAMKLMSVKYFKECLIPQSSQTFIFEQDEEATAV